LNVVCDASTLIALARIGQLDILGRVGARVMVPMAVYDEVVVKGVGKSGADELRDAPWIETHEVADRDIVARLRVILDAGESEAIALAQETKADLLIRDDEAARNTARAEGLRVVGLLAFLILAKERGMISHIKPLLEALKRQSFFIGDDLYHHILRQAGEV
jgi:predicted nucleic acid-binding protein